MALTDTSLSPALTGGAARGADNRLPIPAALYLLCVLVPVFFNLGPLVMSNLRLLLLIVTVPLLAQIFMGRFGRVYATDGLFVAFILWTFVALAVNNPDKVVQNVGSAGIEFLGGYAVGRAYIRTPGQFFALCRWMVVLVLFTLPFSVAEALTGQPHLVNLLNKLPGLSSVTPVHIEGRLGLERVQSLFAHPIHYGLFCSVAFSMAFVALRDHTSTAWRYVSAALIAFSGFLALSSGALLAIFLQMGLIAWAAIFDRIRWRWWLLVGLFALAYVVIDILSDRSPIRVFMSYATFSAHNAYWRGIIFEWGMKSVWAHPLFGIGLNDWERPWFMYSGSMDNFWLVNGVRYGIPGFALLALGYILIIAKVMRRDFDSDRTLTMIRRAWVFTFLGLTFTLCTVHVWTNIYSFVFFMFGAGVWLIAVQPGQDTGAGTPLPAGDTSARRGTGPVYARGPAAPQGPARPQLVYSRDGATEPAAAATRQAAPQTSRPTGTETRRYSRFAPGSRPDDTRR